MGGTKDAWMAHKSLVAQAEDIAVKAGRLARCKLHGIAYDSDPGLDDEAHSLAKAAVKNGEVDADLESMKAAIGEAIKNAPSECPSCDYGLRD